MNNLHLIVQAIDHLDNYNNKNGLELLRDNYPISDSDSDSDNDSNYNHNDNSVLNISLGSKNGQRKNAPPNSKYQYDIHIHLKNKSIKSGSGWYVWNHNNNWFHLGGNKKNRKPTIYIYNPKMKGKWSIYNNQSESINIYNFYGK